MMVNKWKKIVIEDRKMKDYLITYSTPNGKVNMTDEEALKIALECFKNPNCVRIIIEKEDF